jgi:hypothetical protein
MGGTKVLEDIFHPHYVLLIDRWQCSRGLEFTREYQSGHDITGKI